MPVTSQQGVNYTVKTVKMPLYIKAMEFFDRDYHYKELAQRICQGRRSDEDKVLAIFAWTQQNIKTNIPEGWPVVDDHIWNIIIRGYGADDQSADVFNTLCVYCGIPAMRARLSSEDSGKHIDVSVVDLSGKLSVFDTYRGHYFINKEGRIASLEEITDNPNLIKQQTQGKMYRGIEYARFFENINPVRKVTVKRAQYQMPIPRLLTKIKDIFKK